MFFNVFYTSEKNMFYAFFYLQINVFNICNIQCTNMRILNDIIRILSPKNNKQNKIHFLCKWINLTYIYADQLVWVKWTGSNWFQFSLLYEVTPGITHYRSNLFNFRAITAIMSWPWRLLQILLIQTCRLTLQFPDKNSILK